MPDLDYPARGLDVSGLYQDPKEMDYEHWGLLGFCYGFYSVAIGLNRVRWALEHRAKMRAAGYLTAPYSVLSEAGTPAEQAQLLVNLRGRDDELPNMLDLERRRVVGAMLRQFVDAYDAATSVELWIYTGKGVWLRIAAEPSLQARCAKYGLVFASYPFDSPPQPDGRDIQPMDAASVARRSSVPQNFAKVPSVQPWQQPNSWQHSGHASLPRRGKAAYYPIDLQVMPISQRQLRARYGGGAVVPPVIVLEGFSLDELERMDDVAAGVRAAAAKLEALP